MIELKLLHQAITLASYGNYARAAQALHLTQPALSRSISRLEARVGEKLFNRTSQGVVPTAIGELFISRGRSLLDGATTLERDFGRMRGGEIGELRVGTGLFPARISVGKAVGRLARRHPKLRIDVMDGDLRGIIDALLAGRLDLAVIERSLVAGEPRIATEELPSHQAYFYCRAGHPLLAEKNPSLKRILSFPFVGTRMPSRVAQSFMELASGGSIDRDTGDYLPPIKVDSTWMATDVVTASDAVAVAPLVSIAEEISLGKLVPLSARTGWMQTAYGFVFRRGITLSPAAEAFKQALIEVEHEIAAAELMIGENIGARSASSVR